MEVTRKLKTSFQLWPSQSTGHIHEEIKTEVMFETKIAMKNVESDGKADGLLRVRGVIFRFSWHRVVEVYLCVL